MPDHHFVIFWLNLQTEFSLRIRRLTRCFLSTGHGPAADNYSIGTGNRLSGLGVYDPAGEGNLRKNGFTQSK